MGINCNIEKCGNNHIHRPIKQIEFISQTVVPWHSFPSCVDMYPMLHSQLYDPSAFTHEPPSHKVLFKHSLMSKDFFMVVFVQKLDVKILK